MKNHFGMLRWIGCCLALLLTTGCYINEFGEVNEDTPDEPENNNNNVEVPKTPEQEIEELQERVKLFEEEISPLVSKCENASDMQAYISQIKAMPQVQDAWVEESAFCLTDTTGMLHYWDFLNLEEVFNEEMEQELCRLCEELTTRSKSYVSQVGKDLRVCLLLSDAKNINPKAFKNNVEEVFKDYASVTTIRGDTFSVKYLTEDDFLNYDIYIIFAHGGCEKHTGHTYRHFIETNTVLKELEKEKWYDNINDYIGVWYDESERGRILVYEKFFKDNVFTKSFFKRKPIVYNCACKSLKGDNSFARVFVENGNASAYLGLNISHNHGNYSALEFFRYMLDNHYTFNGAFTALNNVKAKYSLVDDLSDLSEQDFSPLKKENNLYCYETFLNSHLEFFPSIIESPISINPPEAVDMGVSVKWATCNIGATNEQELGDSLRWGEIFPWYSWTVGRSSDGKLLRKKRYDTSNHYNNDLKFNYSTEDIGGKDGTDPVTTYWGEGWRLPTDAEFEELLYSPCNKVEELKVNDVPYVKVTNKDNGNVVYFPFPPCTSVDDTFSYSGPYWSSSPSLEGSVPKSAWGLLWFYKKELGGFMTMEGALMVPTPGYMAGYARGVYEEPK